MVFVLGLARFPRRISRNALAGIIHGPNVTRCVSEGVVTVRPRLRFEAVIFSIQRLLATTIWSSRLSIVDPAQSYEVVFL